MSYPVVIKRRLGKLHGVYRATGSPEDGSLHGFYTYCGQQILNLDQWEEKPGEAATCVHCVQRMRREGDLPALTPRPVTPRPTPAQLERLAWLAHTALGRVTLLLADRAALAAVLARLTALEARDLLHRNLLEQTAAWLGLAPHASDCWLESLSSEILRALEEVDDGTAARSVEAMEERLAALEAENARLRAACCLALDTLDLEGAADGMTGDALRAALTPDTGEPK